jgi:probable HAF family extracellular repeat protein
MTLARPCGSLVAAATLALAATTSSTLVAAPPPPAPQQYTMTDLGTLRDGLESHAQFINKRGQVAGESFIATGARHAFFWDGTTMHDLGSGVAAIVGLNDQGQVALNLEAAPSTLHAALWSDGVLWDLGTLPGDLYSQARGINNRGQVVGYSSGGGVTHGVIWENGTTTILGFLDGGDETFPTLINDVGQVAGYASTDPYEQHAFFWDRGVMTDLSTPFPQTSVMCHCVGTALALNNRGQVVVSEDSLISGEIQALLWEGGSRTVIASSDQFGYWSPDSINDRGEVSGNNWTYPGTGFADINPVFWRDGVMTEWNEAATTSQSNAMNRNGVVVGESTSNPLGVRGFVWDAGQLTELGNASYSSAAAINDRGVIAGSAAIDRWVHAVIWTPVKAGTP